MKHCSSSSPFIPLVAFLSVSVSVYVSSLGVGVCGNVDVQDLFRRTRQFRMREIG